MWVGLCVLHNTHIPSFKSLMSADQQRQSMQQLNAASKMKTKIQWKIKYYIISDYIYIIFLIIKLCLNPNVIMFSRHCPKQESRVMSACAED